MCICKGKPANNVIKKRVVSYLLAFWVRKSYIEYSKYKRNLQTNPGIISETKANYHNVIINMDILKNLAAKGINTDRVTEAMVYFSSKIKCPSKTMLFKLLAELDFRHFQETGLPVTNLEYDAWKFGPVAPDLFKVLTKENTVDADHEIILTGSLGEALSCEKVEQKKDFDTRSSMYLFHPKRKADLKKFTPRQQRILKEIVDIYKNATPGEASRGSHEPDKPWSQAVAKHGREGVPIDYLDLVNKKTPVTKEEAEEMIREAKAAYHTYK